MSISISNRNNNITSLTYIKKISLLCSSFLYCGLFINKNIIFINNNNFFINYHQTPNFVLINDEDEKNKLLQNYNKRLYYIYKKNDKLPSISHNRTMTTRSMRHTRYNTNNSLSLSLRTKKFKGGSYSMYIPIADNQTINFNLPENIDFRNLFRLPDESYNAEYFSHELNKQTNGSYIDTTKNIFKVYGIFLCFFHIDDFEITSIIKPNSIPINSYIECSNIENLTIPNNSTPNRKYVINKYQDHVKSQQLLITAKEIYDIIYDDSSNKLYPVNVDAEYKRDPKTKQITRTFYLDDGTHRIYTLKRLGYVGLVPCICFDYLPHDLLL